MSSINLDTLTSAQLFDLSRRPQNLHDSNQRYRFSKIITHHLVAPAVDSIPNQSANLSLQFLEEKRVDSPRLSSQFIKALRETVKDEQIYTIVLEKFKFLSYIFHSEPFTDAVRFLLLEFTKTLHENTLIPKNEKFDLTSKLSILTCALFGFAPLFIELQASTTNDPRWQSLKLTVEAIKDHAQKAHSKLLQLQSLPLNRQQQILLKKHPDWAKAQSSTQAILNLILFLSDKKYWSLFGGKLESIFPLNDEDIVKLNANLAPFLKTNLSNLYFLANDTEYWDSICSKFRKEFPNIPFNVEELRKLLEIKQQDRNQMVSLDLSSIKSLKRGKAVLKKQVEGVGYKESTVDIYSSRANFAAENHFCGLVIDSHIALLNFSNRETSLNDLNRIQLHFDTVKRVVGELAQNTSLLELLDQNFTEETELKGYSRDHLVKPLLTTFQRLNNKIQKGAFDLLQANLESFLLMIKNNTPLDIRHILRFQGLLREFLEKDLSLVAEAYSHCKQHVSIKFKNNSEDQKCVEDFINVLDFWMEVSVIQPLKEIRKCGDIIEKTEQTASLTKKKKKKAQSKVKIISSTTTNSNIESQKQEPLTFQAPISDGKQELGETLGTLNSSLDVLQTLVDDEDLELIDPKETHKQHQLAKQAQETLNDIEIVSGENEIEEVIEKYSGRNMNLRSLLKVLLSNGYQFKRFGGRHRIYWNPVTNKTVPVPHHTELKTGTVAAILKEALT